MSLESSKQCCEYDRLKQILKYRIFVEFGGVLSWFGIILNLKVFSGKQRAFNS